MINTVIHFLFPVKEGERKAFFLLCSIMFFVVFNNTIARNLKDVFLVMNNGALSIAFIKFWGVLPATVFIFFCFAKISNLLKQENVFYLVVSFFILFFILFGCVIFPHHQSLILHQLGNCLREWLPASFKEPISLIEYWHYSLFYIISELWGTVVVSLLFWQFANAVIQQENAKRIYPFLGVVADLGVVTAGLLLVWINQEEKGEIFSLKNWQHNVQVMTLLIVAAGISSMCIYFFANRYFKRETHQELQTQKKTHLSLTETVTYLGKSPNIRYLSLMVLGFSISNNLIEVAWKCELEHACSSPLELTSIMGYLSIITGLVTIFLMLIGGWLLRTQGWLFSAMVMPVFMVGVGALFFGLLAMEKYTSWLQIFGYSGTLLVTAIGSLENILGKPMKYALFDPTKEIAFIPLDLESKLKGKAVVDLLGVRVGKSMGSLFHQGVAIIFGSFQSAVGLYIVFYSLVMSMWIISIRKMYNFCVREYVV